MCSHENTNWITRIKSTLNETSSYYNQTNIYKQDIKQRNKISTIIGSKSSELASVFK